jgi:hypothetical protein
MFAELNSEINSRKSSLLHLTSQPYWKKKRSAKVKDGIITYFLGTISLDDTIWWLSFKDFLNSTFRSRQNFVPFCLVNQ